MDNYIPPSDYFVRRHLLRDPLEIVEAILASKSGDHSEIRFISNGVPEFDGLVEGQPAPMDMATMLFLACIDWDLFRDSSKSLDGGGGQREAGEMANGGR